MKYLENKILTKQILEKSIETANALGTDLLEANYLRGCCAECAKYRGRWFSISGKDKHFPKLPIDYGCTCEGLVFSAVYSDSSPRYYPEGTDMIKISNRPFVDDRTDLEKEIYEISRLEEKNELFWYEYDERWRAQREYDHQQYDLIVTLFPDIAPKSYSGYMQMKKGDTKNYQKLVEIAKTAYVYLEYPQELADEIEYLKPFRTIYVRTISEINKRRAAVQARIDSGEK